MAEMKVQVLLSCMNQQDCSIVERTNIQTDAVVVNQCNNDSITEYDFINKNSQKCHVKFINTTEKGLSRSRNMAIVNATGDYCLICDDDENLDDNYAATILKGFEDNPQYDIIAFKLDFSELTFSDKEYNVNYLNAGRLASVQMAFKNNALIRSTPFNIKMGSGTGNGCGEENKFVLDCLKKGARIKYVPSYIAYVATGSSLWFKGYTEKYWVDRGWIAKMLYGKFWGAIYLIYQILCRVRKLDKKNSVLNILKWMVRGFKQDR